MKSQRIRTKFTRVSEYVKTYGRTVRGVKLTGWLDKESPYLRIADQDDNYLASLEGAQLYRLAKAIVARFEATK